MAGDTWPRVRLETIAATDRKGFAMGPFGSNIKSENYQPTGVPVLRGVNLGDGGFSGGDLVFLSEEKAEELKNSQAFPDDLVFVAQGTVGRVALVPNIPRFQKTVLSQNLMKFSCDSAKADSRFLYYFFISSDGQQTIRSRVNPTGVPCISRPLSSLKEFEVTLPPLAEQKAIAAVLGALDDKIELNRRMNGTLEAMARALFQSWFVDFDPVRAKLDGRPPAALDPATAALFADSFQDSPLGPIPQGWEVCPLSEKIQLLSGGTPKTSEPTYWDGDIPWYSVRDAPSETDVWVIHTDKHVTKLGIANSAAQIFPEKTTIISARGTVGKLALTAVPMAMNQSCYGVRGITGYGDYFTYYSLREATAQLQQRTHGTVFDTITTETFKTLGCIFPTPEITAAFDKLVEPLLGQIRANLHQSHTLATLRDTLLPKLLTGELSVMDEERQIERATSWKPQLTPPTS